MVANGSEPREILLDPMIAGSRGADGCEFDLEVDLECSKETNRKLFRNYENAMEEKRSLKRENETLLDLVERLKNHFEEQHQYFSFADT